MFESPVPRLVLLVGVDVMGLTCISMGAENVSLAPRPLAGAGKSVCSVDESLRT